MWLNDVYLIVFGQQWSFLAQENKVYQALATKTNLSWINLWLVFGPFKGFVDNKKNTEYHQSWSHCRERAPERFNGSDLWGNKRCFVRAISTQVNRIYSDMKKEMRRTRWTHLWKWWCWLIKYLTNKRSKPILPSTALLMCHESPRVFYVCHFSFAHEYLRRNVWQETSRFISQVMLFFLFWLVL